MKFQTRKSHLFLVGLLLSVLLLVAGFDRGPQMSSAQAREKAQYVPAVHSYITKPTVETTAVYNPATDTWRVLLTEQTQGKVVARLWVKDDTGKVARVRISPGANKITYPQLSKKEAIKLATANPRIQQELSKYNSYATTAEYNDGQWTVNFWTTGKVQLEVAQAHVSDSTWALSQVYTGDQVEWQMARGENGAYGKQANYWYVWGPLALVFALAFLRNDRLFSLRTLDVIALLGFLVSHAFFRHGISYEAVLLWYPPLIYLFIRTLLMGFGIGERVERTSNFPTPVLFALGVIASGFLLWLNLSSRVLDIGYAGVAGADRIMHGIIPYGNMPAEVGTGDTYGPLNYLLYIPFITLFGYSGHWDFLPAAHALTAFAYVVGALALLWAGYRFSGLKGGAALFFAWAVFPYTLYATNNNTNDVVVAAVLAVGLALATSPLARGAVVAAGFSIKLFPLMLGPLWMLYERRRKAGPIVDFVLGGVAILVISFWVLLIGEKSPLEAAKLFYEKTFAYQSHRVTPWTIFNQVPRLDFLHRPLTAAVLLLGLALAFVPRRLTVRRLAALSAALVIAFQIVSNYWFYTYVIWLEPLVFLALVPATNTKTALDGVSRQQAQIKEREKTEKFATQKESPDA